MYTVYEVRESDDLESVARKCASTPTYIKEINGFNSDRELRTGEAIVIPAKNNQLLRVYKVKKGDTLYQASYNNNINIDDLVRLNGLNKNDYLYQDQELLIPEENVKYYITNKGDSINQLIEKLEIDYYQLLRSNGDIIVSPDQLIVYKKEK